MSFYRVPEFGGPGEIPRAAEIVPADRWDNLIRELGVAYTCEWFGHRYDSQFTAETIAVLRERSAENPESAA
jgi:hypothetical protein